MVKKAPIVAAVVLVAIVAVLVYGALFSGDGSAGDGEFEDGGGESIRLPFVTGIAAFLAFVAGFAVRDILGRRARSATRPSAPGRKPA